MPRICKPQNQVDLVKEYANPNAIKPNSLKSCLGNTVRVIKPSIPKQVNQGKWDCEYIDGQKKGRVYMIPEHYLQN